MRATEWIALHRGGHLTPENHRRLMGWALECAGHVFFLLGENPDPVFRLALEKAEEWSAGRILPGPVIRAAREVHAAARRLPEGSAERAAARSIGHAAATAHMADHCPGAARYALKAVTLAGLPAEEERVWQDARMEEMGPDLADQVRRERLRKHI